MIELSKQVGELAKQVMIKERYYAPISHIFDGYDYMMSINQPEIASTAVADTNQIPRSKLTGYLVYATLRFVLDKRHWRLALLAVDGRKAIIWEVYTYVETKT